MTRPIGVTRRSNVAGRPALVLANGDLPPDAVVRSAARTVKAGGGIIVCADGGSRHAIRLRIRPDAIVGDLDSLPVRVRSRLPGVPIVRVPDQESTDLEKALRHCLLARCDRVVVAGAIGNRIDHTTGALGCLRKFGTRLDLTLLDGSGELRRLQRSERLTMQRRETFSLVPLGRCTGITLTGALYPLKGETLEAGVREGISNRAAGRSVSVKYKTGVLLLYRMRRRMRGRMGRRLR